MPLDYLKHFLKKYAAVQRPILIAVSGGPDSLALLNLALQCSSYSFGIAHVNHNWRRESQQEAEQIESLASNLQIPFHLETLDPRHFQGNLEDYCRMRRLEFFRRLCRQNNYQGVLLAHHADDLAETVLKRLFEGANLCAIGGMREVSHWQGTPLWRPLLPFTKERLNPFSSGLPIKPFIDSTNEDPRHLRARMRTALIPQLAKVFGKEIASPLQRLSADVLELKTYLDRRIGPIMAQTVSGPMGDAIDLGALEECIELQHAIRSFCEKGNVKLTRAQLDTLVNLIKGKVAGKQVISGDRVVHVDRGRLFMPEKYINTNWRVEIDIVSNEGADSSAGWVNVWSGRIELFLPEGSYAVQIADPKQPFFLKTSLNKHWTEHKVPAFMRSLVPVVVKNGMVVFDPLSGKGVTPLPGHRNVVRMRLTLTNPCGTP